MRALPPVARARPIRVLWVNDHLGYENGVVHGVARLFANILPSLDPTRVEAELCILGRLHPIVEEIVRTGVRTTCLGRERWDPRSLLDLVRQIRTRRIHLLHLQGLKSMLLGRIAARLTGCKVVIHIHDMGYPRRMLGMLHRSLARWTDAAVGCSDATSEIARVRFGIPTERIVTLRNAVPVERYSQPSAGARRRIRKELEIPERAAVIAVVGRLVPTKGVDHAIRALPSVLRRAPDAHLMIVGGGPNREASVALVESLGIGSRVRFTGQRGDVPDLLAAADVLAMPSMGEGLPLACVEALAAGKPTVGYATHGVNEVVAHGITGLLVERGDIEAFAAALGDVLTDRSLWGRLAENCLQRRDEWGVGRWARRLEEVYGSLWR